MILFILNLAILFAVIGCGGKKKDGGKSSKSKKSKEFKKVDKDKQGQVINDNSSVVPVASQSGVPSNASKTEKSKQPDAAHKDKKAVAQDFSDQSESSVYIRTRHTQSLSGPGSAGGQLKDADVYSRALPKNMRPPQTLSVTQSISSGPRIVVKMPYQTYLLLKNQSGFSSRRKINDLIPSEKEYGARRRKQGQKKPYIIVIRENSPNLSSYPEDVVKIVPQDTVASLEDDGLPKNQEFHPSWLDEGVKFEIGRSG